MGGKCSGTSQNTSKVTRPNGEQVQAIWHMQSRANVPSQLLFFQQAQGRQNLCLWQRWRLIRNSLSRCCVSSPSWKSGDVLQTNCPVPQTSRSPSRIVTGTLFPNCMGHTRPPAQEPGWFLSSRPRYHSPFANGHGKSGPPHKLHIHVALWALP